MILSEKELQDIERESSRLIALWTDENGKLNEESLSEIGRLIGIHIPKLLSAYRLRVNRSNAFRECP